MNQIIENELDKIIRYSEKHGQKFTREKAFDFLTIQYFCYQTSQIEKIWFDIENDNFTDGKDDGGIDFAFFDEEDGKVIIGQNKLSETVDRNKAVSELNKTIKTLKDFEKKRVQDYNSRVRKNVQNALDRLTDETIGNIEVVFFHISKFDEKKTRECLLDQDTVSNIEFLDEKSLEELILKIKSDIQLVPQHKFNLDESKNYLEYTNNNKEGVIVNINSTSLIDAYNKYNSEGLFNLNIRRYIRSKTVDDGINQTLNKDRENFWFLNNGLTIACEDFQLDGNVLKLFNFSIVNGGQTTTLISNYKGSNTEEFFVPCKIVKSTVSLTDSERMNFFNNIAEATNSQKPIQPRDLKSNSPEMIQLQQLLEQKEIFLEIKRGISAPKKFKKKIRNDDLAQILFSFVNQKPGTARSNKKSLFSVNKNYISIFRRNYIKESSQASFLYDLIDLNERFNTISSTLKGVEKNALNSEEMNVFSNGKMIIFAILGLFYRLVNHDLDRNELLNQPSLVEEHDFIYASFISNYKKDDIEEILENLIIEITSILTDCYKTEFENNKVTSISNFFKTDKKYTDIIIPFIIKRYRIETRWIEFISPYKELLLRK
ncbi:AIPR family protein [Enterococcus asini]|uniref:AIPR family protein n=1 Tax=Enterococcus asini TaxID=57732 RepID=UPI0026DA7590|nr:AIPR family protein [Enterococcus asini]